MGGSRALRRHAFRVLPLTEAWNDLAGKGPDELPDTSEEDYEKLYDHFEKKYFDTSLVNGAIPICTVRMCAAHLAGADRGSVRATMA